MKIRVNFEYSGTFTTEMEGDTELEALEKVDSLPIEAPPGVTVRMWYEVIEANTTPRDFKVNLSYSGDIGVTVTATTNEEAEAAAKALWPTLTKGQLNPEVKGSYVIGDY